MPGRVLLVLGNSVSLPPPEARGSVVPYPDLLEQRLAPLGWRTRRECASGATVDEIERTARALLPELHPSAVIIQLGIVDCAPRPLHPWERGLLGRLWPSSLRDWVVDVIHRHRAWIIEHRGLIQRTALAKFREHFGQLVSSCLASTESVAILPIFPATESILARNPRLAVEIGKYNEAMRTNPRALAFDAKDLFGASPIESLFVAPESVHLNQHGHDLLARRLETWLLTPARANGAQ